MTHDVAWPSVASAGSLPLDQIICGDNCEVMRQMPSESIDLVVTSPPYDDLRTYGGHSWDFYGVAWNLKRLLKPGGVIVWNVNDATIRGSETGSSMRQALHFQEVGLGLHDTMIWQKTKPTPQEQHPRYQPSWEYMFILSKGYPPRAFNELREPSVHGGKIASSRGHRKEDDSFRHSATKRIVVGNTRRRRNVWSMASIGVDGHPAPFPDELARDHILSWSNPGDVVLDPFSGSGTTAKMARETGRRFIGIEVNPEYVEISRKRLAQQSLPLDVA
jgi:site-specific DNA-methyltransferase (adenine-specific)